MKKNNVIIVVVLVVIVLVAFFVVKNNDFFSDGNMNKIENTVYYTDERAQKLFVEEENYAFINLIEHKVYKIDDTLYIDFYFDKEATKEQIDNARFFALSTFVMKYSPPSEESPYMIFNSDTSPVQWKTITCRTYLGDKLNSEDKYDENGDLQMDSND